MAIRRPKTFVASARYKRAQMEHRTKELLLSLETQKGSIRYEMTRKSTLQL